MYEDENIALPAPRAPLDIDLEAGEFTASEDIDTREYRAENAGMACAQTPQGAPGPRSARP